MRIVIAILCVLTFLGGCSIIAGAKSAIHEIEAFMLFLISAVLLIGGAVIEALGRSQKKFENVIESTAATARHTAEAVQLLRQQVSTLTAQHAKSSPPPLGGRRATTGQTYYYAADGEEMGPYTLSDIREFRDAGVITEDTLLFREGDTQWRAFLQFAEFAPPTDGTKKT
jgi:hypothetical protein